MLLRLLIHGAGAINFGYALYYDLTYVHLPAHLRATGNFDSMTSFPGKWKFLTVWDIVIQLVYHSLALLNDVAGTQEVNPKRQGLLQKARDHLFASWAFPTGTFVSCAFWAVYAIDRELMFPEIFDTFFPNWLNHAVHSAPLIFVFVEHLSIPCTYPKPFVGAGLLATGIIVYMSWITWINQVTGVWAYPILDVLNNGQRAVFMGGCGLSILGFYFIGDLINKWRWGIEESGKAPKSVGKGKRKTK